MIVVNDFVIWVCLWRCLSAETRYRLNHSAMFISSKYMGDGGYGYVLEIINLLLAAKLLLVFWFVYLSYEKLNFW